MKICNDGFVWKILTKKEAVALFKLDKLKRTAFANGFSGFNKTVYLLYKDDSESEASGLTDILEHDGEFGIEVGRLNKDQVFNLMMTAFNIFERDSSDEPMDGDETEKLAKEFLNYLNKQNGNK